MSKSVVVGRWWWCIVLLCMRKDLLLCSGWGMCVYQHSIRFSFCHMNWIINTIFALLGIRLSPSDPSSVIIVTRALCAHAICHSNGISLYICGGKKEEKLNQNHNTFVHCVCVLCSVVCSICDIERHSLCTRTESNWTSGKQISK